MPTAPHIVADDLIEALAELEHKQWQHWSKTAAHAVPHELRAKWERSWRPYAELSDELKECDRVWARRVISLLRERKLILE